MTKKVGVKLFEYQEAAINNLRTGSILCGWVGSGKSITALAYYYVKSCGGSLPKDGTGFKEMKNPKDLYIITTAAKRDSMDWQKEAANFMLSKNREHSVNNVSVVVDSWNSIRKYTKITDAFFIFDEQRVIGSGTWVRSFLKIAKSNEWILLSATPGDTWMDYIPVFVANGFYKNRTEFIREHVVYLSRSKFPKIDHYVGIGRLKAHKESILVTMDYKRKKEVIEKNLNVCFDPEKLKRVYKDRWNIYKNEPIKQISELFYLMRKVVNSDPSRIEVLKELLETHKKIIVFYNFDYELENLRTLGEVTTFAEYNGHKHEPVPNSDSWIYAVQYMSGAEGWNCIETNTIVFYSLSYSYRMMTQAAGRIDRMNTPFEILYYYYLKSNSIIDVGISKALLIKSTFNEKRFLSKMEKR